MAGLEPEGSTFDARQYDAKMTELLSSDGQDFFTTYDEVYESFDAMGLQENLLRGIYAYGFEKPFCKGLGICYGIPEPGFFFQSQALSCSYEASKEFLDSILSDLNGCIQKNTRKAEARKQTKLMSLSGHYQVFHKKKRCLDKVKKNCR